MIEFQYFDGCPNAKICLENLLAVKNELNIKDNEIRIIEVSDYESAKINKFQGSPTILIDGVDIYTDKKPLGYNYSCRIYSMNGNNTGILSKEFIKDKIINRGK